VLELAAANTGTSVAGAKLDKLQHLAAVVAAGPPEHGRNWARTSDLQLVELALSQLSYAPRQASEFSR
jgi:hypothetical protein